MAILIDQKTTGVNYTCPDCLKKLDILHKPHSLKCEACNKTYSFKAGIPIISRNQKYYYGEISKEEIDPFFRKLDKTQNFETALKYWLAVLDKKKADYLIRYMLDERRSRGEYLLNLTGKEKVLDIGCGWGGFLNKLYDRSQEIHGMDLTPERLFFLKSWFEYKGFNNFHPCCGGDTKYLPYPENSFDIVILNGVLEWVPSTVPGDPKKLQQAFLNEIRRVLQDAGQLYFAIENRLWFKYFIGKPDDHSALKFGSLLPRKLANLYSQMATRKPYRTYTYSYYTYLRMLQKTGFENIKPYSAIPIYRYPKKIIRLDGKADKKTFEPQKLKRLYRKALTESKIFTHSYIFVSTRGSFYGDISAILKKEFPDKNYWPVDMKITGTRTVVSKIVNGDTNAHELIARLHSEKGLIDRINSNFKNLIYFRKNFSDFKNIVPKPITKGIFFQREYWIESFIDGIDGYSMPSALQEKLISAATALITKIHLASMRKTDPEDFKSRLKKLDAPLFTYPWSQQETKILSSAFNFLLENQLDNPIYVYSHNDFHIGNLLFDPNSQEVIGIIDFDFSDPVGFAWIDIFHLIARSRKIKKEHLSSSLIRNLMQSPEDNKHITNYCQKMALSAENIQYYLVLYLVTLIRKTVLIWQEGIGGIHKFHYSSNDHELKAFLKILKQVLTMKNLRTFA